MAETKASLYTTSSKNWLCVSGHGRDETSLLIGVTSTAAPSRPNASLPDDTSPRRAPENGEFIWVSGFIPAPEPRWEH